MVSRTPVGSSAALPERPVMPAPVTSTRVPGMSGATSRRFTSRSDGGESLAVDVRHTKTARARGQQPEANDHGGRRPPEKLEVVMERRHPEHPSPGGA